ncbi:hypothetical protein D3C73_905270 [compost metagenome]
MSVVQAVLYPVIAPCNIRSPIRAYTLWASPMQPITTDIPRLARRSIGLRPNRSAACPHTGENNAEITNVIPNAIPENCATAFVLSTPSCLMYSGSTGAIWLIPMPVTNIPIQQTIKFLFHTGMIHEAFLLLCCLIDSSDEQ